jgi:hypothetical protein
VSTSSRVSPAGSRICCCAIFWALRFAVPEKPLAEHASPRPACVHADAFHRRPRTPSPPTAIYWSEESQHVLRKASAVLQRMPGAQKLWRFAATIARQRPFSAAVACMSFSPRSRNTGSPATERHRRFRRVIPAKSSRPRALEVEDFSTARSITHRPSAYVIVLS